VDGEEMMDPHHHNHHHYHESSTASGGGGANGHHRDAFMGFGGLNPGVFVSTSSASSSLWSQLPPMPSIENSNSHGGGGEGSGNSRVNIDNDDGEGRGHDGDYLQPYRLFHPRPPPLSAGERFIGTVVYESNNNFWVREGLLPQASWVSTTAPHSNDSSTTTITSSTSCSPSSS